MSFIWFFAIYHFVVMWRENLYTTLNTGALIGLLSNNLFYFSVSLKRRSVFASSFGSLEFCSGKWKRKTSIENICTLVTIYLGSCWGCVKVEYEILNFFTRSVTARKKINDRIIKMSINWHPKGSIAPTKTSPVNRSKLYLMTINQTRNT